MKSKLVIGRKFGPGMSEVDVPKGLRVAKIPSEAAYWVDEFPPELFPPGSMLLHDAIHYGIRLTAEEVEE